MVSGERQEIKKNNKPKTHSLSAALKPNITVLPMKWKVRARKMTQREKGKGRGVWSVSMQGMWHLGSLGQAKELPRVSKSQGSVPGL